MPFVTSLSFQELRMVDDERWQYAVVDFEAGTKRWRWNLVLYDEPSEAMAFFCELAQPDHVVRSREQHSKFSYDEPKETEPPSGATILPNPNHGRAGCTWELLGRTGSGRPMLVTDERILRISPSSVMLAATRRPVQAVRRLENIATNLDYEQPSAFVLKLKKRELDVLEPDFRMSQRTLREFECVACRGIFFRTSREDNVGFYGCRYNPTMYHVVPASELQTYHFWGCKDEYDKIVRGLSTSSPWSPPLDLTPNEFGIQGAADSRLFCLESEGHMAGLLVARFPLPVEWQRTATNQERPALCWSCVQDKQYEWIWSH